MRQDGTDLSPTKQHDGGVEMRLLSPRSPLPPAPPTTTAPPPLEHDHFSDDHSTADHDEAVDAGSATPVTGWASPLAEAPVRRRAGSLTSPSRTITDTIFDKFNDRDAPVPPLIALYQQEDSVIRKNFQTIDTYFQKHRAAEDERKYRVRTASPPLSWWKSMFWRTWGAAQEWVLLVMVGILVGLTSAVIHLAGQWMAGVRIGVCSGHGFLVSQSLCCLDAPGSVCPDWSYWHNVAKIVDNSKYFDESPRRIAHYDDGYGGFLGYTFDYMMYLTVCVFLAWCTVRLTVMYGRHAKDSGLPEVKCILGGFVLRQVLSLRTLLVKSAGLITAIGSGLSLGKEGPLVHIATCWSFVLAQMFRKYRQNPFLRREVLLAAASAGVSAAFGAPVGGVVFVLEGLASSYSSMGLWRSFVAAMTTAIFLQWADPLQTGKLVQFQVPQRSDSWLWFETVPFLLLGVIGGGLGTLFIRLNLRMRSFRATNRFLKRHPQLEVCFVAALSALTAYPNVYARGSSVSLLSQLFLDCSVGAQAGEGANYESNQVFRNLCDSDNTVASEVIVLLVAAAIKFCLSLITFGMLIPAGMFIPSMCVGALIGRAFGWTLASWHNSVGDGFLFGVCRERSRCIYPGMYAVIGAAAMLCGVTRLTVSLAVIMLELTGGLDYMTPIVLAVVSAKVTADFIERRFPADVFGVSTTSSSAQEYEALGEEEGDVLAEGRMGNDSQSSSSSTAVHALGSSGGLYQQLIYWQGFPYIDDRLSLRGKHTAVDIMQHPVIAFRCGDNASQLRDVVSLLRTHPCKGFPIVDMDSRGDAVLYGFVARAAMVDVIRKAQRRGLHGIAGMRCAFINPVTWHTQGGQSVGGVRISPTVANDHAEHKERMRQPEEGEEKAERAPSSPDELPGWSAADSASSWVVSSAGEDSRYVEGDEKEDSGPTTSSLKVWHVVDANPIVVLPDCPADRVLDLFCQLGLRYCLVCDRWRRLKGIIKKKDLLLFCASKR